MNHVYEVERKFLFTFANATKFHFNKGAPPFASLVFNGLRTQHDCYYDTESYELDKHNIWARLRNGNWQIKRLKSGIHEKATYEEFEGYQSLINLMRHSGLKEWKDLNAGDTILQKIADFKTERKSYTVNDKFKVVLDSTNFGHEVGEVELKGVNYERCGREVDEFMAEHQWFFDRAGPVKGKLKAYWEIFPRK
ncbi:hypothetical protein TWF696_006672 [Orbilia brochopaga]|uniref:CYTH domain-containing protein n=1 Tax=Orbilia brochopaga TaxID=3140254 RepID=A0AAV9UTW6_9PEZI